MSYETLILELVKAAVSIARGVIDGDPAAKKRAVDILRPTMNADTAQRIVEAAAVEAKFGP